MALLVSAEKLISSVVKHLENLEKGGYFVNPEVATIFATGYRPQVIDALMKLKSEEITPDTQDAIINLLSLQQVFFTGGIDTKTLHRKFDIELNRIKKPRAQKKGSVSLGFTAQATALAYTTVSELTGDAIMMVSKVVNGTTLGEVARSASFLNTFPDRLQKACHIHPRFINSYVKAITLNRVNNFVEFTKPTKMINTIVKTTKSSDFILKSDNSGWLSHAYSSMIDMGYKVTGAGVLKDQINTQFRLIQNPAENFGQVLASITIAISSISVIFMMYMATANIIMEQRLSKVKNNM